MTRPLLPPSVRPLRTPAEVARHLPVTLGLLAVLLLTAGTGLSHRSEAAVGAGVGRPAWRLLTSALWCSDASTYAGTALVCLLLVGSAERRLGSRVTVIGLVAGQFLGTALGLAAILALRTTGDLWSRELSGMVILGPLPGALAVAGLATARTAALWRRRLRLSVTITLVALLLYSGTAGDVVRLCGWSLGLAAGLLLRPVGGPPGPVHFTRRESRALVALVVAATALGPLLAAVSRTPDGPWAVVSHLFVSAPPQHAMLRAVCGHGGDPADCRVLQARAQLTGRGPALLSILPVLLQLVLAEGLRRGRRAAWVGAVAFSVLLTLVGGIVVDTLLRTPADSLPLLAARPGSLPAVSVVAPLAAPLTVLMLLLLTRRRFGVRAAPGAVRRWMLIVGGGMLALSALYVLAGSLMSAGWAPAPSPLALLADLPRRMLPPGYLGEVPMPLLTRDAGTRLLGNWTGVIAWALILLTAARLLRPGTATGDAGRARALVTRHGDRALSFMATWTGNRYWFTPDGAAVVAYRVIGGVALTTGDPIGAPAARAAAISGFTSWCEEHGWTPCWYSVTDEVAEAMTTAGAHRLQVAAETWLPLGDLSFSGRRWQDVRTAMNRAAREGIEARWTRWASAPLELRDQVARLSEDWLARKGLPEMGFTLGGLDEVADVDVRCLLAVDRSGRVHGFTSWLPAHRDGVLVGWTLDVMRRADGASPGTMEFLIATAALTFQSEGVRWISLSGAPLALPPEASDRSMLTRLLELAGRTLEPVYGFRSLLAFKAKFQPRYRPLWLVYPGPADLPRIARAVSAAYLPEVSPGRALRLVSALLQGLRNRPRSSPAPLRGSAPGRVAR